MAKLDKDFFLKHRFWIGLGVFALLWVVVLVLLPFTIGSEAGARHKEYADAAGAVDKIKSPPKDFANPNWDKPLQEKEADLKVRKDEVWAQSWKTQAGLMDWPGDNIADLKKLKNAYFLDPIPKADERRRYEDTLYASQLAQFKDAIAPAYYKGGSYEAIIQPVKSWSSSPPVSDECWFAQEDLWVKRELTNSLRRAIDTVARFDKVEATPPKDLPAGAKAQSFKNVNWAVTLVLETATGKDKKRHLIISPKSTITNVNPNYRKLPLTGVFLEVEQHDRTGGTRDRAYLALEGDPVPYGETVPFKKEARVDTFVPDQPMEVRQVFTWFTSPVKRLDRLEVGNRSALAHRFAKWGLVSKSSAGADAQGTQETTPPPSTGGGMPSMGGGSMAGIAPPMTGAGGRGAADKGQPSVERNRYLEVSDQVRRIPVAMVLVVDQSRIQDVLTALIDSRLHVWITQWEWQHAHGVSPPARIELAPEQPVGTMPGGEEPGGFPMRSMSPGSMGSGAAGGTGMPGGTGGMPGGTGVPGGMPGGTGGGMPRMGSVMPPGMSGGMGSGMPGGMGSGMPRMGGFGALPPSDQMAVSQDDANLVELTVYGIASLYERYPPKPPAAEGGAAPGAKPAAPAGGLTPAKPAKP